jgi:hypothetical protein
MSRRFVFNTEQRTVSVFFIKASITQVIFLSIQRRILDFAWAEISEVNAMAAVAA